MKKMWIITILLIIILFLTSCIFGPESYSKRWLCTADINGTDLQYLIKEDIGIVIPNLDGTKLIGYHNYEIYSMNLDGTGKETLVEYIKSYYDPEIAMTPEGEMIVFNFISDIYTLNLETNVLKNITIEDSMYCYAPSFSSDGQKICYGTNDYGSITTIHTMDYNGDNKKVICSYEHSYYEYRSPYFVNTDDKIMYLCFGLNGSANGIYLVDIDGTNNHRIYDYAAHYSVSHSSTFIVFSARDSVFRMNIDGTELQLLALTYDESFAPAISPDDSKILYPSTDHTMYAMDSDGSNNNQVCDTEYDLMYSHYKSYNFGFINNERVILSLKK